MPAACYRRGMIVPYGALSDEALVGVVEEYVSRDGTELSETPAKIADVKAALKRGDLVLVFDPESESCNLLPVDQVPTDAIDKH